MRQDHFQYQVSSIPGILKLPQGENIDKNDTKEIVTL